MILVTIRSDKPEAEVGIFNDTERISYSLWPADKRLAETLQERINRLLHDNGYSVTDLNGVLVYKGPGSFTGLRIGISVANALAYALNVPIVGAGGPEWLKTGINVLVSGGNERIVVPEYGAEPHITPQKK